MSTVPPPSTTGAAGVQQPGGVGAYASPSLYVGDLVPEVSEALLFEIFNAVGPVASVRICRDAATRRSLGYGYVNFHRVDDAELALDTMNFKSIRGKPCRIMWSHRDPSLRKSNAGNIFIKNLAKSIDNKILSDTFSVVGNILSCKVATNSKGESLGYGFVHYQSEQDAQAAIKNINGMIIEDQKVVVSAFKSKVERGGTNKFKFTNVYVKNLPVGCTKEKLEELFGKHGEITSSMIGSRTDKNGERVFGFVNYSAPEMAAAAVEELNETEMEGQKLYVVRAQKKDEREKELRDRFEQLKVERQKKYAGVNLYVKNLADDVDDEALRSEFSKFGAITSAKVMMDGTKSRGFGFVCFSSPEEATKAVTEMNGQMLNNKPLYVALAQRKEVRRAQLAAQHDARSKLGMPQPQMYPGPQNAAPMFYQPGIQQPRGNFVYPQQILPRARWPQGQGNNQGGPQMMGVRQPMNYHLMPVQPGQPQGRVNGMQGGPRGGPNQGRGGRGRQGQQMNGQRGGGPQQQQGYKYNEGVRNNQRPPQQPAQQAAPEQAAPAATEEQAPFDVKVLAAASDDVRQRMIGERLFPLIKAVQPTLAGKITGMLLEMEVSEVLHLVTSKAALHEKIDEAMAVLKEASGETETQ